MPPFAGTAHCALYKYSQIIPNTSPGTRKERRESALKFSEPVEATPLYSVSFVRQSRAPTTLPSLFTLHRCHELALSHRRWLRLRAPWPPPPGRRSRQHSPRPAISAARVSPVGAAAPAGGGCGRRCLPGGRSFSRRGPCRTPRTRRRASIRTPAR